MFYFVNEVKDDEKEENHIIYFWNPSIRKFKKLQATPLNFHDVVVYGLAYYYQNNDYKILRINFYPIFHQSNVEIYTLSTDSWRL